MSASEKVKFRDLRESDLDNLIVLLESSCMFDRADAVASQMCFERGSNQTEPTGIVALIHQEIVGVVVFAGRYLRILAVSPDKRGMGIGTSLLDVAIQKATKSGASTLQTLGQPGNYLGPGIDVKNIETIDWLKKRGFVVTTNNTNLFVDVANNDMVNSESEAKWAMKARGYRFERLATAELKEWQDVIGEHFSEGWAFEVGLACQNDLSSVHVAYDENQKPAAFAAHDGNNRGLGWFGPTGTLNEHRGRGLAAVLLLRCLLDVKKAGHSQCQIAWIGPKGFYEKVCGVIGERHFVVLTKKLAKVSS